MATEPTPKRRAVKRGHTKYPGVYWRERLSARTGRPERVYEITYIDSDGKRRWKTISGGLEEARATLDDIRSRRRRGERIAPTKATLAELVHEFLPAAPNLRDRTRTIYATSLKHATKKLGTHRVAEIEVDDIATLIASMQAEGLKPWTIKGVLTPLSRVFAYAVRRGICSTNPVKQLDRTEKPRIEARPMRVLDPAEIGKLLKATTSLRYETMLAVSIYAGLRQGELLGLAWSDVDTAAGRIRVRRQLNREGGFSPPKTASAVREVEIPASLSKLLAKWKLSLPPALSGTDGLVFGTETGRPMAARNATRRALESAITKAKIPPLRWHDMRHCYASLLISAGLDPVYVSKQMGHANPAITLSVYAHLFDRQASAEKAKAALEASFPGQYVPPASESAASSAVPRSLSTSTSRRH